MRTPVYLYAYSVLMNTAITLRADGRATSETALVHGTLLAENDQEAEKEAEARASAEVGGRERFETVRVHAFMIPKDFVYSLYRDEHGNVFKVIQEGHGGKAAAQA